MAKYSQIHQGTCAQHDERRRLDVRTFRISPCKDAYFRFCGARFEGLRPYGQKRWDKRGGNGNKGSVIPLRYTHTERLPVVVTSR